MLHVLLGYKDLKRQISVGRMYLMYGAVGCYFYDGVISRLLSRPSRRLRSGTSDPYCIVKVDNEVVAR